MFSIQFKLLIIAIFLGTLVIFLLQNTQAVTFVLLSYVIPKELSVGILILLAVFAGILTSLILQLLNSVNRKVTPQFSNPNKTKIPQTNYNYPPPPRPQNQVKSDFQESSYSRDTYAQKEKIKEVKPSPNPEITEIFDKKVPKQDENDKLNVNETSVKKDNIYSYNYQENKDKKNNQTDDVYDANYRVIVPPYQEDKDRSSTNIQDNNEEDWV